MKQQQYSAVSIPRLAAVAAELMHSGLTDEESAINSGPGDGLGLRCTLSSRMVQKVCQ